MMNDRDRKRWVDNDDGLNVRWKKSGMSKRQWIQENRRLIDDVAGNGVDGIILEHYFEHQGARSHGKW